MKQMKERTAPGTASLRPAIVVLGGSFAPVHAGHLAALEAGKRAAENAGFTVVGGYLVCAPQFHVSGKLRGRGQEAFADEVMGAEARLRMCNAVAADSDWLLPTSRLSRRNPSAANAEDRPRRGYAPILPPPRRRHRHQRWNLQLQQKG